MLTLGELAEHYRREIVERNSYDFLAKDIELADNGSIDIFRYDLGSDSVHLVGFFQTGTEDSFEEKREASNEWLEYFNAKGFNVMRSLKSDRSLSDDLRPAQGFSGNAYISSSITSEAESEIIQRLNPYFEDDLEGILG